MRFGERIDEIVAFREFSEFLAAGLIENAARRYTAARCH